MRKSELKKLAYDLRLQDYSYGEIATELNKPRATVHRWVKNEYKNRETAVGDENDTIRNSSGTNMVINEANMNINEANMVQNRSKKLSADAGKDGNISEIAIENADFKRKLQIRELENSKQAELLQIEVDKLLTLNKKLQQDNNLLSKRNKLLIKLQNKVTFKIRLYRVRNSELEDEISMLQDPAYITDEEMDDIIIPAAFINIIAEIIEEYLNLDGTHCYIEAFDVIIDKAEVLKSEINSHALDNGLNVINDRAMIILSKFINDMKGVFSTMQKMGMEEIKLNIKSNWKQEMVNWLKTIA